MFNLKNPKKTKWFWIYIVLGVIFVLASIVLAPIWQKMGDWCFWKHYGIKIINWIIAGALAYYLITYLLPKINRCGQGTTKTLMIIEFVLMTVVGLGCILSEFKIINVSGACRIFGLALWCRGSVEVFRAYFHQRDYKTPFPLWYVFIVIGMVTLGTYCVAAPFISDIVLLWMFVIFLFVFGIYYIVYGVKTKPNKPKTEKTKN